MVVKVPLYKMFFGLVIWYLHVFYCQKCTVINEFRYFLLIMTLVKYYDFATAIKWVEFNSFFMILKPVFIRVKLA